MIDISTLPNVDPATGNLINGEMHDVTTPGDGTGTPVRKDWMQDLYYALVAVMNDAGVVADNSEEGATSSQFLTALLTLARRNSGPSYRNLTAKLNTGTPNTRIDIAWDELWIEGVLSTSFSATLDITESGALGLDTGSAANSTWYYVWAICNDAGTTVSAILSASATAPTLPSGYTRKRWISAVYRQSDGTFRAFGQNDNNYRHIGGADQIGLFLYSTSTSMSAFADIDCNTWIPDNVKKLYLYAEASDYTSTTTPNVVYFVSGSIAGQDVTQMAASNTTSKGVYASPAGVGYVVTDNKHVKYRAYNVQTPVNFSTVLCIIGFEVNL